MKQWSETEMKLSGNQIGRKELNRKERIVTGLPQELFWSERSRLSSLPPDDPGRTAMGNCPLSYSCWSPGGRRQHLPMLLPMVYQWRTGLGCTGYIRIVGGVMLRFHFISVFITFHLYISLFHNLCLDCALPCRLLMFFIHFISLNPLAGVVFDG